MSVTDQEYTTFGISAVYKASDDFEDTVTIIFNEYPDSVPKSGVNALSHMGEIKVRQSEVKNRPDSESKFTITSTDGTEQTWTVRPEGVKESRATLDFDAEWICSVQRDVRPAFRR